MQNNLALKYGMLTGVGVIAYFLVFYWVNIRLFFHPAVNWGVLAVYLVGMIKSCWDQSRLAAEFSFPVALRTAFLTFTVAAILYYIFYYVLYNFINPDLSEVQKEILVEQMGKMAGRFQLDDLKEQIQEFSKQDFRVTVRNSLLALGQSLIGGFLLSLGVAALTRR